MSFENPWIEAARPRTLPAAVAPVLVGSGLAAGDGVFLWGAFLAALVGALAIQIAANFANDVSDAERGADTSARTGPKRMVASGVVSSTAMWRAVAAALGVATVAGAYLIVVAGWVVVAIGLVSIAAMLTYVGGPAPYGYRGLGEVAVFVFFGLVATVGTRYVFDRTAPPAAWLLGAVMGLLAAAILVANNLRDIETDRLAGKRTLAVMIGDGRTRTLYIALVVVGFSLVVIGAIFAITPVETALAAFAAPLAAPLIRRARTAREPVQLVRLLSGTARLQLILGALLSVGAAVSSATGSG